MRDDKNGSVRDLDIAPKCASYVRVSSSTQRDDATIEVQIDCNRRAISKLGGIEVEEFRDEAVSGYSRSAHRRPALVRLVEAVQEGSVDIVVFFEESRLTRQIIDFYHDVCGPITRANPGIKFYRSLDEVFWDPNSAEAKQNLIFAFQESHRKARLAKQSQQYRFQMLRQRPGARLPLGISEIRGDRLIPDENFPLVVFIFELASIGYSSRHIADKLNKMGLTENHNWQHTAIHYILGNPIYIGHLAVGRRIGKNNGSLKSLDELSDTELIKNRYNALVPIELWELVHMQMKYKSDDKSVRTKGSFLLSGILKCSSCGELMRTQNSLKRNAKGTVPLRTKKGSLLRYYWCPGCKRRVDPDEIETVIVNRLSDELSFHISAERIRETAVKYVKYLNTKIEDFDMELQERHIQIDRLENGYYRRKWDSETIRLLKALSEERIQELHVWKKNAAEMRDSIENLHANEDIIRRMVSQAQAIKSVLPVHELRALVMHIVDKVDVRINHAGITSVDSIEYRTLPLHYISRSLKQFDSA